MTSNSRFDAGQSTGNHKDNVKSAPAVLGGVGSAFDSSDSEKSIVDDLDEQMTALEEQIASGQGDVAAAEDRLASLEEALAHYLGADEHAPDPLQTVTSEKKSESPVISKASPLDSGFENHAEDVSFAPASSGVDPISQAKMRYAMEYPSDELRLDDDEPGLFAEDDDKNIFTDIEMHYLDEGALTLKINGNLKEHFEGHESGEIYTTGDFTVRVAQTDRVLMSKGCPVHVKNTPAGYEGRVEKSLVFTLKIDSLTGEYHYVQVLPFDFVSGADFCEGVALNFGVERVDPDGKTERTSITISIPDDSSFVQYDAHFFDVRDGLASGNVITGENARSSGVEVLSLDRGHVLIKVSFAQEILDVSKENSVFIDGEFGVLEISANGSYRYTLFDSTKKTPVYEAFEYTLKDEEGLVSSDILKLKGRVEGYNGEESSSPTADVPALTPVSSLHDYNILFVVDVPSLTISVDDQGAAMTLLTDAMKKMLQEFSQHKTGRITVHFTPFSVVSNGGATFTITDSTGLRGAEAYLTALSTGVFEDYPLSLKDGVDWLQGAYSLKQAQVITYFISNDAGRFMANSDFDKKESADEDDAILTLKTLSDDIIDVDIYSDDLDAVFVSKNPFFTSDSF